MHRLALKRLLSLVLVLTMLVQLLPAQALATEQTSPDAQPEIQPEAEIVGEVASLRTETGKHFRLSDGSYIAVSYGKPVHYQNQDGAWADIDNRPIMPASEEGGMYQVSNGQVSHAFSPTLSQGALFTASNGSASVAAFLLNTASAMQVSGDISADSNAQLRDDATAQLRPDFDQTTAADLTVEPPAYEFAGQDSGFSCQDIMPENLNSSVLYEDVYPGVDILYTLSGYDLKEDIIIRQLQASYRFDFFLRLSGLTALENGDGSVSLLNADQEEAYHIPAPYMRDAAGNISDDVTYTVTEVNGGILLTVTADEAWIEQSGRSLPVTIDPTLQAQVRREHSDRNADIYAAFVKESEPDVQPVQNGYLYTGNSAASNGQDFESFLYFNRIPTVPAESVVTNAELKLLMYNYSSAGCPEMPVGVYEVTGQNPRTDGDYYKWFDELSWNTKPAYSNTVIDYVTLSTEQNSCYVSWNVTETVKKWYNEGTTHRVLALGDILDNYDSNRAAAQCFASYGQYNTPLLLVSYRSNVGVESYYSYQNLNAGNAGSGYLADASGQITVTKSLAGYSSTVSPFSLNAVYNSHYFTANASADYHPMQALGLDMTMGPGWKLDWIQGLVPETINNVEYLKYYDGDGTVHYFRWSYEDYDYYDEDGLGLKIHLIMVDTTRYKMTDLHGNAWFFNNGRLVSTEDSNGNTYTLTFENNRLTSIQQKNTGADPITVASFGYTGSTLTSVADAAGNVTSLAYTDNRLSGVTFSSTTLANYGYDGNHLTQLKDTESGYAIDLEWTSGHVSSFKENAGGTDGAAVDVSYPNFSQTTYHSYGLDRQKDTADDIYNHYLFDYAGHTVNTYSTDAAGNVLGAGNASYTPNTGTSKKNNRIEQTGAIGVPGQQLMRNTSLENQGLPWTCSGNMAVRTVARTGSAGFSCNGAGSAQRISQSLISGKEYTFSGYVRLPEAGQKVYLQVKHNNAVIEKSDAITYQTDFTDDPTWVRLSVTFTAQANACHVLQIAAEGTGMAYADDFQLETGEAPSSYNLVDNGSFQMTPHRWTLGSGASIQADPENSSDTVLVIQGNPEYNENAFQNAFMEIPVNLPGTQTYVLSGWGKADAAPDTVNEHEDPAQDRHKQFGLRAGVIYSDGTTEYHYVPFNTDLTAWQFVNCVIVPKEADKTVSTVRVVCAYETNVNTAYFDDISLVREAAQTMRYDENGNLVSVTSTDQAPDTNTYDGGNLMQSVTAGGGGYEYNYDNTYKHRITSVVHGVWDSATNKVTDMKITQTMGYDTFGNVNLTTLQGTGDAYIKTSAEFTNSGNLLSSVTDATNSAVTYTYGDSNSIMRGAPTSVTAPNGLVTTTAYDQFGRVMNTCVDGLATLGYTYSNGNLSSIVRTGSNKTQTYGFTYDSFGNNTSIKVGNTTLAAYTYGARNGLLTRQIHGEATGTNLLYTDYTYDDLGRTKTETTNSGRKLTYAYTGDGQLHSVTETRSGSTNAVKWLYQYDSIGRLISSERQANGTLTQRVFQSYNEKNQVASHGWQIGSDYFTQGYTYNEIGSLATTVLPGGETAVTYNYDGLRRVSSITNGTLTRSYAYENLANNRTTARVKSISYGIAGHSELDQSYNYFVSGRISSVTAGGKTTSYIYDYNGQLLRENNQQGGYTKTWTYDQSGNILSQKTYPYTVGDLGTATKTVTYAYGDSNWGDKLTSYNGNEVTYGSVGNILSDGTRNYGWFEGRRLVTTTTPTGNWNYTYDIDNLRTTRMGTDSGTSYSYEYFYDGGKLVRMVRNGQNVDIAYAGGIPMTMTYGGNVYYYVTNMQGDVLALTDADKNIVASYSYEAYGAPVSIMGDTSGDTTIANLNPLRYRGYVYDNETGLYYLQSRYYDPEMCRFISADDTSYLGADGTCLSYNLFAYCGNNPVTGFDPTGNWDWGGVLVGVGILAATAITIATCGIATPLGALIATAAVTTGALTTYAAATDSVMVIDASVSAQVLPALYFKAGGSIVIDFENDNANYYAHYGLGVGQTDGLSYSVGKVDNYSEPDDYAKHFVDVNGAYNAGFDHCWNPFEDHDSATQATSATFSPGRGFGVGYDYYCQPRQILTW